MNDLPLSLVVRINERMTVQNTNLFRDLGIGALLADFTVQPKNNARARSGARSSCAIRIRKSPQEVKMSYFCGLPARTFETQEAESLTARSRKKLKIFPQEAARSYENYRKPQESARSFSSSR